MSGRRHVLKLVALLLAACAQSGPEPAAPAITAQGFDIADPRVAVVGEFGDVRLRLEVPGQIEEIRIADRAFETDLAKTLVKSQFSLFGVDQRPYSRTDVTLNLRKYINERLAEPGDYTIEISVTDHSGRSVADRVRLDVRSRDAESPAAATEVVTTPVETAEFRFRRIGPGGVSGAGPFGITWITVDPIRVTIRVAPDGATRIARLAAADFQDTKTRTQLAALVEGCAAEDSIEFDTTNAAAAGQVLAVINGEQRYILQAHASETSLDESGTTVVVTGRYKY